MLGCFQGGQTSAERGRTSSVNTEPNFSEVTFNSVTGVSASACLNQTDAGSLMPQRTCLTEVFAASDPSGNGMTWVRVRKNAPAFAAGSLDHAQLMKPSLDNTMTAFGAPESALVSRHLGQLSVANRVNHFFKHEYLRLLRLVKDMRDDALEVPTMLALFRRNAMRKSVSSWGHVFYEAVMSDAALMDYLRNGQLPANL
ncbi:MAG: hypothetical protein EOP83_20610 [Verrucomicrobiaceae bacterium]|nr:MAG: hypothetical protein EOP83_20610 [Verrucomicrobiaceae bacterium]